MPKHTNGRTQARTYRICRHACCKACKSASAGALRDASQGGAVDNADNACHHTERALTTPHAGWARVCPHRDSVGDPWPRHSSRLLEPWGWAGYTPRARRWFDPGEWVRARWNHSVDARSHLHGARPTHGDWAAYGRVCSGSRWEPLSRPLAGGPRGLCLCSCAAWHGAERAWSVARASSQQEMGGQKIAELAASECEVGA